LDDEAEKTLAALRKKTGLSISEVLKRGLIAYRAVAFDENGVRPYEIYRELDLGEGGYATAQSRDAKTAVVEAIERKRAR
jgi:hypothetical protein